MAVLRPPHLAVTADRRLCAIILSVQYQSIDTIDRSIPPPHRLPSLTSVPTLLPPRDKPPTRDDPQYKLPPVGRSAGQAASTVGRSAVQAASGKMICGTSRWQRRTIHSASRRYCETFGGTSRCREIIRGTSRQQRDDQQYKLPVPWDVPRDKLLPQGNPRYKPPAAGRSVGQAAVIAGQSRVQTAATERSTG